MSLPVSFTTSMRSLLAGGYDDFISAYDDKAQNALRVNTTKITVSDFERIAPYKTEKIPFTDNGYYISDTDAWSKHPYYYAGLYYLQEPSAMLPALTVPVDDDSIVLDLCAAPGGKSTALLTRHPKVLVSNDISFSRTMALVKNLEMAGATQTFVTCCDPEKLAGIYPGLFDCILVDAPCSGEGMFRKDHSLITAYEKNGPETYADIQKEILGYAYTMLKPGGFIMYSTCTFSDIEDEQVIISFINEHRDVTVCDIDRKYGLCGPYAKYDNDERISGCVHALWHRFRGEGHFMALLQKQGAGCQTYTVNDETLSFSQLEKEVREFAKGFTPSFYEEFTNNVFLTMPDGFIYMLTPSMAGLYNRNVRYVRTGTCVGSINRYKKFTPHTALALIMKKTDHSNTVSFSPTDPMTMKYLKGETLTVNKDTGLKKGYVLVCVDDHPLGFALFDGTKMKNLYEKGWILR